MSTIQRDAIGNSTITFNNPPQVTPVPEMDFNAFQFYKQTNLRTEKLKREEFWNLILLPKSNFVPGVSIKMQPVNGEGPMVPAHIPSISDCKHLHTRFPDLLRWHFSNELPLTQHILLTSYLMHLIDPEPILDLEQVPFNIATETETLKVSMASYADALQVVRLPSFHNVLHLEIFRQLAGDSSDHHTLVIDPFSPNYIPQIAHISSIPQGTILVCWNVRGVARQSFIKNFKAIYELHMPSIVVLLETRNTVPNLSEIVSKLPSNYSFVHSVMECHSSGAAVLWRWEKVYCHSRYMAPGEVKIMDIMIQGYPENWRKRH